MSPLKIFIICLAFAAIVPTEALLLKKKIALLKTVPKLKKHKVGLLLSSVPKLKTQKIGLLSAVPKLKTQKVKYLLSSVPKLKTQKVKYLLSSVPKFKKQALGYVLPSLAGSAVAAVKPIVTGPAIVSPGLSVSGSQVVENSIRYQPIAVQYVPYYQPTKTIVATGLPSAVTYQHVNYPSFHTKTEISANLPAYQKIVKF